MVVLCLESLQVKLFVCRMLAVVLTFALLGMSLADDCCSGADRHAVLDNWKELWSAEYTGRRVAVGKAVFEE